MSDLKSFDCGMGASSRNFLCICAVSYRSLCNGVQPLTDRTKKPVTSVSNRIETNCFHYGRQKDWTHHLKAQARPRPLTCEKVGN